MDDIGSRFAVLETKMDVVTDQNDCIIKQLLDIAPQVRENSWWCDKIKWMFVLIAVSGVGLGIVSWIRNGT